MRDTRIVALVGPRQSGKTTLARRIAMDGGLAFLTLNDEQTRSFANDDPTGFLRGLVCAVIDENLTALAARLGVDGKSVDRWLTLLEQMFLLRRVRAWHRNDLKRLVKAPKLHFLDSGLLAALQRVSADDLRRDRSRFGALLESFVYSELCKLIAQSVH